MRTRSSLLGVVALHAVRSASAIFRLPDPQFPSPATGTSGGASLPLQPPVGKPIANGALPDRRPSTANWFGHLDLPGLGGGGGGGRHGDERGGFGSGLSLFAHRRPTDAAGDGRSRREPSDVSGGGGAFPPRLGGDVLSFPRFGAENDFPGMARGGFPRFDLPLPRRPEAVEDGTPPKSDGPAREGDPLKGTPLDLRLPDIRGRDRFTAISNGGVPHFLRPKPGGSSLLPLGLGGGADAPETAKENADPSPNPSMQHRQPPHSFFPNGGIFSRGRKPPTTSSSRRRLQMYGMMPMGVGVTPYTGVVAPTYGYVSPAKLLVGTILNSFPFRRLDDDGGVDSSIVKGELKITHGAPRGRGGGGRHGSNSKDVKNVEEVTTSHTHRVRSRPMPSEKTSGIKKTGRRAGDGGKAEDCVEGVGAAASDGGRHRKRAARCTKRGSKSAEIGRDGNTRERGDEKKVGG